MTTGTPSNGQHNRKCADRDGTTKPHVAMSNISETINSIDGMPTRDQVETVLKVVHECWGWEGQLTMPDPEDAERVLSYFLTSDGVFRMVEL